jgi:hypothetical protein
MCAVTRVLYIFSREWIVIDLNIRQWFSCKLLRTPDCLRTGVSVFVDEYSKWGTALPARQMSLAESVTRKQTKYF